MIDLTIGRQTFDFDCGAKALQLVMAYYGTDVREDELIKELGTDSYGAPVANMIAVAEKYGFRVTAQNGTPLETVKEYVDRDTPVIVLVQAWAARYMTLEDWRRENQNGHYVVVIGHESGIIIFEDPSSFHRTWMTEEEFLARWHDVDPRTQESYQRFAMALLGKEPAKKVLEHMD